MWVKARLERKIEEAQRGRLASFVSVELVAGWRRRGKFVSVGAPAQLPDAVCRHS